MSTIYIVSGSTGAYEDYVEWSVCAYEEEYRAKDRVKELEDLIVTLGIRPESGLTLRRANTRLMQEHVRGDPYFSMDYTSTSYSYSELELIK